MKIKVCGLNNNANIFSVSKLAIDYVGFIFYKDSPRYFNEAISFDEARAIPKHINKTGVFVNENIYSVFDKVAYYNLDTIQLHGNESPEYCIQLLPYVKIIKAFGMDSGFNLDLPAKYENSVNYFLFDTLTQKYGGSGTMFDHRLLEGYNLSLPFFVSGGLSLEKTGDLLRFKHKKLAGYDLNSRFEIEPGLKDINKLNQFIKTIHHDSK